MRLRTLAGLAVVTLAGIFAVAYAPTNLGGHTTYVSTYGTSMLPRFHAGDLAVVQPASRYRVGDIVAYRSSVLDNKIVLHRIIADDGGHFTMKGDNNDFDDPVHPTAEQIVGRMRVRIPKGGAIRALVARPLILFPLVAIAIGFASSGLFLRKKRRESDTGRSQRGRRAPPATTTPDSRRRLHVVVPVAAAVAAIGFIVAIGTVWRIPASEPATRNASYTQRLEVGYSGAAAKGAVYPDGAVHTGDPVFTRLVKAIDVNIDYTLTGDDAVRAVGGTSQFVVNVSSTTGWSSSFPLTPATKFSGTHLRTTARLPIARLHDLEARVAAETGLDASQSAISIAPHVRVHGKVGSAPFTSDIDTKLDFTLSPVALTPASTAHSASVNEMAKNGSVRIAATRPGTLTISELRIPAGTAKLAVVLALALALAATAVVLVIDRERVALGEIAAIERRYGRYIVAVGSLPPAGDRTLVSVESMRALAQLAQVEERPIVRGTVDGRARFALATDAVVYYYDATPPPSRPVVTTAAAA